MTKETLEKALDILSTLSGIFGFLFLLRFTGLFFDKYSENMDLMIRLVMTVFLFTNSWVINKYVKLNLK